MLGTPNSTFHNFPAVHGFEARDSVVRESFAWRVSSWVFGAGRSDDYSIGPSRVHTDSERMHDAAVDLGLFTAATSSPSTTTLTFSDSPIEFVMKDEYAPGEPIEIRIRNNGAVSYSYDWLIGCPKLKSYSADGPRGIQTSFHCDQIITTEIRPGEEADLWTWHQNECAAGDFFVGCYQSCLVRQGRYGVFEYFHSEDREPRIVAEHTFVITGADGQIALPAVGPGRPPPTHAGGCGEALRGIEVNLEDLGGSGSYMFDPSQFTFDVGDRVTFTLWGETEFHTFTVGDLDIDVDVDEGTTETFSFTFDQPGTFQLICIPHEALGMTGTITVKPTPQ